MVNNINIFMSFEEYGVSEEEEKEEESHYYGDSVRRLFLIGALVMAVSLPFISELIEGYVHFSLFIIILLGLVSGLISPKQRWVITLNLVISLVAVAVFEYYAVNVYSTYSINSFFFWVNQVLSINFLLALYYNSKTFRGIILNGKE